MLLSKTALLQRSFHQRNAYRCIVAEIISDGSSVIFSTTHFLLNERKIRQLHVFVVIYKFIEKAMTNVANVLFSQVCCRRRKVPIQVEVSICRCEYTKYKV